MIAARLYDMPILVVHSDSDETCPQHLEESLWVMLEGNLHFRKHILRNVDHCGIHEDAYCSTEMLFDWLLQHASSAN